MTYQEHFAHFEKLLVDYANGVKTKTFDDLVNEYQNLVAFLPPDFLDKEVYYDTFVGYLHDPRS